MHPHTCHPRPPLLFDLDADVGEDHPISNTTSEYRDAMQTIRSALREHLSTMTAVPNQMCGPKPKRQGLSPCVGGSSLDYTVCKDPRSEDRLPFFPNCTSNPEYFNRSINCYAHHKMEDEENGEKFDKEFGHKQR